MSESSATSRLTPLQRALVSILVGYLATIVALGSGPIWLESSQVSTIAGILLATTTIMGTYWAFRLIGRGFFRRALVIWIGFSLLSSSFGVVSYYPVFAPGVVASGLAQNSGVISEPLHWTGSYLDSCKLISGQEQFHQASGYDLVSYSKARAFSQASCNGVGYFLTETLASGVFASAQARASIWFIDRGITVPSNGGTYSNLSILLDFLINGWQAASNGASTYGHSSVAMIYSLDIVRDDGYREVHFSQYFDGAHSFGGDYDPVYNEVLVEQGHSYSLVVAFNVTSSSTVLGPLGLAHSLSCYQSDTLCARTPNDSLASGYCSQGLQELDGKCFAIQWKSSSYSIA